MRALVVDRRTSSDMMANLVLRLTPLVTGLRNSLGNLLEVPQLYLGLLEQQELAEVW